MLVLLTIAGQPEQEKTVSAGFSLRSLLADNSVSLEGAAISVNGRPLTESQITSYTLNDEDSVYVGRSTKLGN